MTPLLLIAAGWLCPVAEAHELELQPLELAVETSVQEVEQLSHDHPLGRGLVGTEDAFRSYERAVSDLFLGDTAAAAERLYALRHVLADPALVADVEWHLVTALEAEGLPQLRDELLADITRNPEHPYGIEAAAERIRHAAARRRPALLTALADEFRDQGMPSTPTLTYAEARAWVELREPAKAIPLAATLAEEPGDLGAKGAYLVGAAEVLQGDLAAAAESFRQARDQSPDPAVRDHATLALARIAYERGEVEKAIEAYQSISGASDVIDQALYELAWSYVRAEHNEAAIRTIELYLLSFGEQADAGRMALVRAHLLMKEEHHYEAETAYAALEEELFPLDALLRELSPERLAELLDDTSGSSNLPLWVKDHVHRDLSTTAALETQHRATELADDIAAAQELASDVAGLADKPVVLRRHRRVRSRVFDAMAGIGRTLLSAAHLEIDARQGRAQRQRVRPLRERADALDHELHRLTGRAAFQAGMEEMEVEVASLLDRAEALLVDLKADRDDDHHDASYERFDEHIHALVAARVDAEALLMQLESASHSLREPLLAEVQVHRAALDDAHARRLELDVRANDVWRDAARAQLLDVRARIDDALRASMSGLADASWAQMESTATERDALIVERDEKVERLEALFEVMRARQ